jgi:hypothetical protein
MKLEIDLYAQYNWNIFESGVKHHKPTKPSATCYLVYILISIGFCDHRHIDTPRPVPIKIRTHDRLVGMSLECLLTRNMPKGKGYPSCEILNQ